MKIATARRLFATATSKETYERLFVWTDPDNDTGARVWISDGSFSVNVLVADIPDRYQEFAKPGTWRDGVRDETGPDVDIMLAMFVGSRVLKITDDCRRPWSGDCSDLTWRRIQHPDETGVYVDDDTLSLLAEVIGGRDDLAELRGHNPKLSVCGYLADGTRAFLLMPVRTTDDK